jgi:hypothetical protein
MNTSDSSVLASVTALARQIEQSFPGAQTELVGFRTGAVMLKVRWRDRLFVMAYSPAHGSFGVDEVEADTGIDKAFDFTSPRLDAAAEELLRRLKTA